MKKNMISVLILALLVINIILSALTMFSVTGTSKKTARLIDGISSALTLEVGDAQQQAEGNTEAEDVPMKNIAVYKIEDQMTIPLAKSSDGKDHYCLVSVSLSMNTKADGYKDYGETVADKEDLIKGEIVSVISNHTIEEVENEQDAIRQEILERIQKMYDSKFVYNVVFRDILFQ